MQKAKFTSILFLYNGNSFVTDTYLSKVLSLPAASGTQEEEAGGAPGTQDNNTDEVSETQDNSTDGEDMEVQDTENTDLQDGETNDETE